MKPICVLVPPKRREPRAKKDHHQRQSHMLTSARRAKGSGLKTTIFTRCATQLTIIGLASAELRTRESETWNANQTKAINAIEAAVQDAGNLIANLSRMLADKTAKKSNATPKRAPDRILPANNVYPISPAERDDDVGLRG
jgi:hypothetical protein